MIFGYVYTQQKAECPKYISGLSQSLLSKVLISGGDNWQLHNHTDVIQTGCVFLCLSVLPFVFSDWTPRNRTSEAERTSSPAPEDTGYDDIEELGH